MGAVVIGTGHNAFLPRRKQSIQPGGGVGLVIGPEVGGKVVVVGG